MRRLTHRANDPSQQSGQAAIELVGFVFLVVVAAVLCVQAVFAVQAASAAQEAARNGARALSLGDPDWRGVVAQTLPDWADVEEVTASGSSDSTAQVRVAVRVPIGIRSITSAHFAFERTAQLPMMEDSWH
jgi:hypothetical protein